MMLRYRSSSTDTIRAAASKVHRWDLPTDFSAKSISLWVHDDAFSKEDVLFSETVFGNMKSQSEVLVEVAALKSTSEVRDFQGKDDANRATRQFTNASDSSDHSTHNDLDVDPRTRYIFTVRELPEEIKAKHPSLQISISVAIANAFGFRNRSQVVVTLVTKTSCKASHVEIGFRDVYLARSDMWKLVESELVGKTVYTGQKILFLGSIKALVKNVHVQGHKTSTAYFAPSTVPVFRSEAARYVLFIQMSREMWDFDSEGNGEILFNRVINGFLPDLFRRWSGLEVKHLVTIVMFGRLEYGAHDFINPKNPESLRNIGGGEACQRLPYEDFYRVVVTDMASAKWMTILDELKKDFRVFLRDISLDHHFNTASAKAKANKDTSAVNVKIRGRPSTAMKGNILEAINIASSQFANDYIDRDLIRTGISVVVITAGSGVFEVDRNLLSLTSENLTNNGIGIDIVCLSRMPLHSAPLFRYAMAQDAGPINPEEITSLSTGNGSGRAGLGTATTGSHHHQSFPSSTVSSLSPSLSRVTSSLFTQDYQNWQYGIPQWIDLSYWTSETVKTLKVEADLLYRKDRSGQRQHTKRFIPRVRMYELQMMGIMELGLANISIPYMKSTSSRNRRLRSTLPRARLPNGSGSTSLLADTSESQSSPSQRTSANEGLLTAQSRQQGDRNRRMDDYDSEVFAAHRKLLQKKPIKTTEKNAVATTWANEHEETKRPKAQLAKLLEPTQTLPDSDTGSKEPAKKPNKALLSMLGSSQKPENARISRSISYALRGLAPPPRAAASTGISVDNVQAHNLPAIRTSPYPTTINSAASIRSFQSSDTAENKPLQPGVSADYSDFDLTDLRNGPSQPISINASKRRNGQRGGRGLTLMKATNAHPSNLSATQAANVSSQNDRQTGTVEDTNDQMDSASDGMDSSDEGFKPGSVSQDTLPFIRNVNASNPVKYDPNAASWFGRWQHLYPRKPRAATVKWRSLCTPASVPLTTAHFPDLEDLESKFDTMSYVVSQKADNELREVPRTRNSLFTDMLALRLAHGYQWLTHADGRNPHRDGEEHGSSVLLHEKLRRSDGSIYMTMGSTLQSLIPDGEDSVCVTRYRPKKKADGDEVPTTIEYCPNIRTILSSEYTQRKMTLTGFSEEYPWELADSYLADSKKTLDDAVETLRFWRARFVLLPVEPPSTAWKLAQSTNENDEEIHLLGIRALTQMWQRQRYVPPQEKTFQKPTTARKKDLNPLSILFETLNPSEIVATELEKLLAVEDGGEMQPTQLLPDSDLFERETSTLQKLAHAMQGEKGIEIKNRRWHLRLHYNCFQGEDFTNWMLRDFREGEFHDRDDCVEFGNTLMEGGLFTHVNGRHNFKDGNYFYSIAPEYRAHRTESRQTSWFPSSRRSDRSVPATPIAEKQPKDFSPAGRVRSGSDMEKEDITPPATMSQKENIEKNRVSISLSKMIPIDVDPRKRSSKVEVANLYYDRLHNPENCYRFALTWPPTTTSALVENALGAWASLAEKYGLRLVEVPIAEASKVTKNEPFRAPYRITLAAKPPKKGMNGNGNLTSTSFAPPSPDPHSYQKALLKRFNFVLDHEAASEFSSDVDVLLAWGKLEYTMTQYVHRSGVILAQITGDGNLILLANRLYNTRLPPVKDTVNKFDARRDRGISKPPQPPQPAMQASGILGLNVQHPSSPAPSPMVRASADVFGNKAALNSSGFATFITPEQIKDEVEAFASDASKLEAFYREIASAPPPVPRHTGSSVMRPDKGPDLGIIPEIRLPPSIVTSAIMTGVGASVSGTRKVSPQQQSAGEGSAGNEENSAAEKSPRRGNTSSW